MPTVGVQSDTMTSQQRRDAERRLKRACMNFDRVFTPALRALSKRRGKPQYKIIDEAIANELARHGIEVDRRSPEEIAKCMAILEAPEPDRSLSV